jgi:tRNA1Val (adenine37-N6)-methyltransferase
MFQVQNSKFKIQHSTFENLSKPFHFKKFTVEQDKTAMKIGTDGILLGAWVNVENASSILDIGAGTGVISLMMAQRSNANLIDAVEIDEGAYEQCVDNFENSPWGDRLFCYHASFIEFAEEMEDEKYDLIVSNPPFFKAPLPAKESSFYQNPTSDSRKTARYYDSLPFTELLELSSELLSDEGELAVIIPYAEELNFLHIAEEVNLHPNRITHVRGNKDSSIIRSLIQLSFTKILNVLKIELILEKSRHVYTEEYKYLVRDFYLKM